MRSNHLLAALPILLLAACGGGSGGGGGNTTNTGAYEAEAFGYVDPYPSDFHPLGRDEVFAGVRRDEIACLFTGAAVPFAIEDVAAGADTTDSLPATATAGITVLDADTGDLDGDGKPELVLLGTFGPAATRGLRVRVLGMDGGVGPNVGSWTLLGSFDAGGSEGYRSGRVDVGDVDGDGRAEIVVAATRGTYVSWVRVYEDPVDGAGHGVLLRELSYPGARAVRGVCAQLDDDRGKELAIHVQLNASAAEGHVFDDAAHDFVQLTSAADPLYSGSGTGYETGDLVAVNRDEDGRDEIGFLRSQPDVNMDVFDDAPAGFELVGTQHANVTYTIDWHPDDPLLLRRFSSGDIDADGLDEVVLLVPHEEFGALHDSVGLMTLWGTGGNTLVQYQLDQYALRGWDVAVVDHDGDGLDEIVIAVTTTSDTVYWNGWEYDPDAGGDLESYGFLGIVIGGASAPDTHVVLAGDDFDVDGVRLRWTGVKYQRLPNPIPMAVLAAPPTKAGISQDYDASDVTYAMSQGWEYSYETSTTHSGSLTLGWKWKDVFGAAEVSVKGTLKGALQFTYGESNSVSTSVSYTGSHDHDVVIFQGTLHMVYVYEILSAHEPGVVGTEMTINVPVGTKVYKWTREFFEDRFGPDSFLADAPLEHVIGDPASYATEGEASQIADFGGDPVTVGQGNGSNGCELSMENEITQGDGWSWGVEVDVETEIGGFQGGLSYGFEREHLWEVTVSRGTSYECTIGDIADPAQWDTWAYDTGLFTYTHELPERSPYQIVTFWTQPWGSGYAP